MNLSDANIHCTCPEAKSLERQHLSSTHTLAIMGYIEPKWVVICQKFVCLEMEMTNALLDWNKSCCFFTPFCKGPRFTAFLAAEPFKGHPSARICSVRVVPSLLKNSNNLFSGNWSAELVYWTWTSPHLKAFPTGYHQHICLNAALGDYFILCLSLVWKGFSRKIPHNQFFVTRHTLAEIFHVFYQSTLPSSVLSLSFLSMSL